MVVQLYDQNGADNDTHSGDIDLQLRGGLCPGGGGLSTSLEPPDAKYLSVTSLSQTVADSITTGDFSVIVRRISDNALLACGDTQPPCGSAPTLDKNNATQKESQIVGACDCRPYSTDPLIWAIPCGSPPNPEPKSWPAAPENIQLAITWLETNAAATCPAWLGTVLLPEATFDMTAQPITVTGVPSTTLRIRKPMDFLGAGPSRTKLIDPRNTNILTLAADNYQTQQVGVEVSGIQFIGSSVSQRAIYGLHNVKSDIHCNIANTFTYNGFVLAAGIETPWGGFSNDNLIYNNVVKNINGPSITLGDAIGIVGDNNQVFDNYVQNYTGNGIMPFSNRSSRMIANVIVDGTRATGGHSTGIGMDGCLKPYNSPDPCHPKSDGDGRSVGNWITNTMHGIEFHKWGESLSGAEGIMHNTIINTDHAIQVGSSATANIFWNSVVGPITNHGIYFLGDNVGTNFYNSNTIQVGSWQEISNPNTSLNISGGYNSPECNDFTGSPPCPN